MNPNSNVLPFEPAAEVREHRYVNVAAMAANVVAMAAASAMQDRKDTDARMEREKAIGEQMMRDFKALAAERGVEVPVEIGGKPGWLCTTPTICPLESACAKSSG